MGTTSNRKNLMTRGGWGIVETASRLLESGEREAVVGDVVEANESTWQALANVLGLVVRRQAMLWKEWHPWFAGFAVALPSSYLLMIVSLSVTCTYQRLVNHKSFYDKHWPTGHEGFLLLLCHVFLLIAWSWAGGYLVASLPRKTIWASACLSVVPGVLCLVGVCSSPFRAACFYLFCQQLSECTGACETQISRCARHRLWRLR
jgi:hypothetical protein